MMSGEALRDLNTLHITDRKIESSGKGSFIKPHYENINLEGRHCENAASLVETPINGDGSVKSGVEVGNAEVEYIESENLNDVEDVDTSLKTLLAGLDSKDWVLVCEALNDVRRLSIFHKEAMLSILKNVVPVVVKSLKNPRSAVCKTAIMTSADIFSAYGDHTIDSLDPLLVQLLLKSSQDKRFVCEAAERALVAMTTWVSPVFGCYQSCSHFSRTGILEFEPRLQCAFVEAYRAFLANENLYVRSAWFLKTIRGECSRKSLGAEGVKAYGIDKLVQIAACQLSDQLPESREAARTLLMELQTIYEKCPVPTQTAASEDSEMGSWEHFCQSKLSPLSAQAVLRVTNIAREGLVLGS